MNQELKRDGMSTVPSERAIDRILEKFQIFLSGTAGIGQWISKSTDKRVLARIASIDSDPLTSVQLNQLLILGHEAPVSNDFFRYYWLDLPRHCHDVRKLPGYSDQLIEKASEVRAIVSIDHLYWGLYRLFVDGLLFFGNARSAFRALRNRSYQELQQFFLTQRYDTEGMSLRGPGLPLEEIAKDDRYLISEMACKSLDCTAGSIGRLGNVLMESWERHKKSGGGRVSIKHLLDPKRLERDYPTEQTALLFSADDLLDQEVASDKEVLDKFQKLFRQFEAARKKARTNTEYYLSMANELDAYVATSMRTRADFRQMADFCNTVFSSPSLSGLHLRYFDPTLSAADGHEDKGLIECLMVKCAKMLLYCAGDKESFGKDAEASMALSLGKPVIFYCQTPAKTSFYRNVHPLCRLINFQTGVAVGALITDDVGQVTELIRRIYCNEMEYCLEQHETRPGYLRLKEKLTGSLYRLHTNDHLLAETFWNHYNQVAPLGPITARF